MSPAEAIRRLSAINIEEDVIKSIEETATDFIRLNEDQWKQGSRTDGLPITPYPYSVGYARKRQKEGLQTDHIDLYRKGNLYKGYSVKVASNDVEMESDVNYEKYVSKRYEKIWGLSPENIYAYTHGPFWSVLKTKVESQTGFRYV